MGKVLLIQYNAGKRYYISVSTKNYSRRKTGVEELGNDLAGKSLLEGVFLYINKNHPFNSFKEPLAFIFFVVVIYQRLYTRWFAIAYRLQYKDVLFVCGQ